MKCEACGAELADGAVYCQQCGARLDATDERASESGPGTAADVAAADEPAGAADRFRQSAGRRGSDDKEEELWAGRYSAKEMLGTWILIGLASIALLVLAIWLTANKTLPSNVVWGGFALVLLVMWGYPGWLVFYRKVSVRYRLTSQRFFHEKGILRHVTDRIEVIDMDDISYVQTLLQRMVGVGTIHITSSDQTHPVLNIRGIKDVRRVSGLMDDARRQERMRRGLHIESV